MRRCREAVAADRAFGLEYRVARAAGGWRWVLDRGIRTVDRQGHAWLDGVIFDITERREAEAALRRRDAEEAHIAELQASRARIVAAADDARRRLARDLHDGAQQRFISAQLRLNAAERQLPPGDPARTLLGEARAELDVGLAELRELARGIHPAVLTDHGLGAAVRALTLRCAIPVELHDRIVDRLPRSTETALYYLVAEGADQRRAVCRCVACGSEHVERSDMGRVDIVDDGCGRGSPTGKRLARPRGSSRRRRGTARSAQPAWRRHPVVGAGARRMS